MIASPDYIDLRIGMVLHVVPRNSALTHAFATVIRDVGAQSIQIDAPPERDVIEFEPDSDVTLFLQHGGRIYRLESRVRLSDASLDAEGVMVLDHPVSADETDRRQYYRLLTTIAPRYAARVNAAGDELERLDARILDLSGGGMQLHSRHWVPVGSRMRLIFAVDGDPQEVDANMVALSVVRPGPRRSLYRVHCRFVDMARAERERLVRFIFRKQIDFRQRGVG